MTLMYSHNLYFLGSKTTKNLVFIRLYRKYERLKNASNSFTIKLFSSFSMPYPFRYMLSGEKIDAR